MTFLGILAYLMALGLALLLKDAGHVTMATVLQVTVAIMVVVEACILFWTLTFRR